jgi:hypothetical protein
MAALRDLRKLSTAACLVAVLAITSTASAASEEDKAGARAAATQGETAFNAKRWADAVDLFTRAESLVHSPVHLLFKARALIQLGQLVKARETLLEITREQADKPSPALLKAQDSARLELTTLEPRLAAVVITVQGPGAATATVTMDGAKVPPVLIGLSHPVDPGEHHFEAAGNGVHSNVVTLALKEGGTGSVALTLSPVATASALPVATPASSGPSSALAANGTAASDSGSSSHGNGLRVASYVAFGVGAVGLAAGTVFGVSAKNKYDDGNALCKTDPCNLTTAEAARRTQLGKDGDSAKTLSLVGFIAGGVGIAAGAALFVLGSKTEPTQAGVQAYVGLGSLGLAGKF